MEELMKLKAQLERAEEKPPHTPRGSGEPLNGVLRHRRFT